MPILEIFVSPDQQWTVQHPKCPVPHLDSVWIATSHTRCWAWSGVSQLPFLKRMWPDQGLQRQRHRWSACLLPNSLRTCISSIYFQGFRGGASDKEPACQCRRHKRPGFNPWVGKMPWRRAWQSILAFLPGESHGQGSLAGYSP